MSGKGPRRFALVPDTHAPFHDERAWGCAMNALADWRPKLLCHLGDLADMYAASFHERDPDVPVDAQAELDAAVACRKDMDSLGAVEKHIRLGNHERRWDRLLMSGTAAQLRTLRSLKLDELLGFTAHRWQVTPHGDGRHIGNLYTTHELDRHGRRAHEQAVSDVLGNAAIGHTHGLGAYYAQTVHGVSLMGVACGWLGRYSDIKYRHRARAMREWHHGFAVGYVEADGTTHLQLIPIRAGRCIVEGRVYRA